MNRYVVSTVDLVNARLAGTLGGYHVYSAKPRSQALALVRTLLGNDIDTTRNAWSIAIPHGRRIVTITPADGHRHNNAPAA